MRLLQRIVFRIAWRPAVFLLLRNTERTRVIITDGDKILLVRGRIDSLLGDVRWNLPGGGVHRHERPVDAASRELYEELALRVDPEAFKFMGKEQVTEKGLSFQALYFALERSTGSKIKPQRLEIAEAAWVRIGEIGGLPLRQEVGRALSLRA